MFRRIRSRPSALIRARSRFFRPLGKLMRRAFSANARSCSQRGKKKADPAATYTTTTTTGFRRLPRGSDGYAVDFFFFSFLGFPYFSVDLAELI